MIGIGKDSNEIFDEISLSHSSSPSSSFIFEQNHNSIPEEIENNNMYNADHSMMSLFGDENSLAGWQSNSLQYFNSWANDTTTAQEEGASSFPLLSLTPRANFIHRMQHNVTDQSTISGAETDVDASLQLSDRLSPHDTCSIDENSSAPTTPCRSHEKERWIYPPQAIASATRERNSEARSNEAFLRNASSSSTQPDLILIHRFQYSSQKTPLSAVTTDPFQSLVTNYFSSPGPIHLHFEWSFIPPSVRYDHDLLFSQSIPQPLPSPLSHLLPSSFELFACTRPLLVSPQRLSLPAVVSPHPHSPPT
jgi:hypothetical protein